MKWENFKRHPGDTGILVVLIMWTSFQLIGKYFLIMPRYGWGTTESVVASNSVYISILFA